jgi:hypothetical protein
VICLDLDIAVQGRSFAESSQLLREAIGLYLEAVNDLPETERAALLSRPVPFWTRFGLAIAALWSAFCAKKDGELAHRFTIVPSPRTEHSRADVERHG